MKDKSWLAEARTEETKSFIRQVKRITRRKFTPEEKIRIVLGILPSLLDSKVNGKGLALGYLSKAL